MAEVEELVEPGALDPESVHLPGVFVQRIVHVGAQGKRIERITTRPSTGSG
ncbi:MAG TPA: CoA-transferase [Candidatus Cybelea sp.]